MISRSVPQKIPLSNGRRSTSTCPLATAIASTGSFTWTTGWCITKTGCSLCKMPCMLWRIGTPILGSIPNLKLLPFTICVTDSFYIGVYLGVPLSLSSSGCNDWYCQKAVRACRIYKLLERSRVGIDVLSLVHTIAILPMLNYPAMVVRPVLGQYQQLKASSIDQ